MNNSGNVLTNNNPGVFKKPIILKILEAILQGQPYFVILLVLWELLAPLVDPGSAVNIFRLVMLTVWLGIALLLLFVVGKACHCSGSSVAYSVCSDGRLALGEHLRKLSMGFFKGRDPGDLTALMLQDYSNVEMMLSHLALDAIGAVVLPIVFMLFLFPVDWRMALIAISPIPLALIVAYGTRVVLLKRGRKHMQAKNGASSRMLEYLDGIKNIKAFNLHGKKFARLEKSFREFRDESIKIEAFAGPVVILGLWVLNAGIALIMLTGFAFVINGTLSVPYFLFFLIVGTKMYDPLSKVLVNFAELTYYSVSVDRIAEIYATKPLPEPDVSVKPDNHDVEFKNVWFRYHEKDVLKDVSFSLPENTMTALVGPSGSGKTTITQLIARFWDVNQGEIMVGGYPLGQMKSDDLLDDISMVFQDVYLFNTTILDNIRMGNADATMDEVLAATRKARCHEFIEKLPDGYQTMVGEGGATLSGGEKQRISIARAILKDAPIILLDEATASLDPENELYIQEAIGELIRDRTIIVIAHRLSTITKADQILVLDEGEIVERGTHAELMAEDGGAYQNMWNEQKRAHGWKLGAADGEGDLTGKLVEAL